MAYFQRGRVLGQSRYGTLLLRMRMVDVFSYSRTMDKTEQVLVYISASFAFLLDSEQKCVDVFVFSLSACNIRIGKNVL